MEGALNLDVGDWAVVGLFVCGVCDVVLVLLVLLTRLLIR